MYNIILVHIRIQKIYQLYKVSKSKLWGKKRAIPIVVDPNFTERLKTAVYKCIQFHAQETIQYPALSPPRPSPCPCWRSRETWHGTSATWPTPGLTPPSSILNPSSTILPYSILHSTSYIPHSPFSSSRLLLTFHSFGGGTDSALTSLLIERLSGRLRQKIQTGVCNLRGPPSGHRWGGALPPTKHPYHLLHHPCHLLHHSCQLLHHPWNLLHHPCHLLQHHCHLLHHPCHLSHHPGHLLHHPCQLLHHLCHLLHNPGHLLQHPYTLKSLHLPQFISTAIPVTASSASVPAHLRQWEILQAPGSQWPNPHDSLRSNKQGQLKFRKNSDISYVWNMI